MTDLIKNCVIEDKKESKMIKEGTPYKDYYDTEIAIGDTLLCDYGGYCVEVRKDKNGYYGKLVPDMSWKFPEMTDGRYDIAKIEAREVLDEKGIKSQRRWMKYGKYFITPFPLNFPDICRLLDETGIQIPSSIVKQLVEHGTSRQIDTDGRRTVNNIDYGLCGELIENFRKKRGLPELPKGQYYAPKSYKDYELVVVELNI